MSTDLIEKIAEQVARLPVERQREALAFVESLAASETGGRPQTFRSVKGLLHSNLNLENDVTEVRREMWQAFPREEPK